MSRRLRVDRSVVDKFPGIHIAVASASIAPPQDTSAIDARWREAWAHASAELKDLPTPQSHPRIEAWRSAFKAIGISGKEFPSSIEALARRARKDAEPFRINPVVDFYNSVSLRHLVPAGGFDLDAVTGDIDLRLTREDDFFWSLDALEPLSLPAGEVAYADGDQILTRHFVWRQSRRGLITESTRNVVLVAEVLEAVGPDTAAAVAGEFRDGLRELFGSEAAVGTVTPERLEFSLDG